MGSMWERAFKDKDNPKEQDKEKVWKNDSSSPVDPGHGTRSL